MRRGPSRDPGQTGKWRHEWGQRRSQQARPEPSVPTAHNRLVASVRVQSNPEAGFVEIMHQPNGG